MATPDFPLTRSKTDGQDPLLPDRVPVWYGYWANLADQGMVWAGFGREDFAFSAWVVPWIIMCLFRFEIRADCGRFAHGIDFSKCVQSLSETIFVQEV